MQSPDYNLETSSVTSNSTAFSRQSQTSKKSVLQLAEVAVQNQEQLNKMLLCFISVMAQPRASFSKENS